MTLEKITQMVNDFMGSNASHEQKQNVKNAWLDLIFAQLADALKDEENAAASPPEPEVKPHGEKV